MAKFLQKKSYVRVRKKFLLRKCKFCLSDSTKS